MPRYSREDLIRAHNLWASLSPDEESARLIAWELYVDIRDGLEIGTTTVERVRRNTIEGDQRAVMMDLDG